jgi:hypothetical protein
MINTLRITSVVAVILAGAFFILPVVCGVRSNQRVEALIAAPGVRENFEHAADSKTKSTENRASPLVQQAEAFALYLNPPKSKTSAFRLGGPKTASLIHITPPTTPKFKVLGTSYCPTNPKMSLVLIDEPGSGLHWVRQSSKVGHLLVEEVKDGLVVVKSGKETYELTIEQVPEAGVIKTTSSILTRMPARGFLRGTAPVSSKTSSGAATLFRPGVQPRAGTEDKAKLEELARKLINVQKSARANKGAPGLSEAERTARTLELISQYKAARRSTRVSDKEAKKLGDLGQTLQKTQAKPNRVVPMTGKDNIEADSAESSQPAQAEAAPNK